MNKRTFKDKVLYNDLSWLIPGQPLIAWADITNDLNNFYKRPEINLTDIKEDLKKKNAMRHIVGLARMGQTYFNPLAIKIGSIKENLDYVKDFLNPSSFGYITNETKDDTKVDWGNNLKGINFTDKYSNASGEDIMQYAWKLVNGAKPIEEQPKSKLYEKIINKIETKNEKYPGKLYGKITNY